MPRVGLAAGSPSVALEVSGTISATNFVGNGSGLTGVTAGAAGVSGSIQFNSGGALAGRSDFIISNSGFVGIGTSAPTAALDVSGSLNLNNSSGWGQVRGGSFQGTMSTGGFYFGKTFDSGNSGLPASTARCAGALPPIRCKSAPVAVGRA